MRRAVLAACLALLLAGCVPAPTPEPTPTYLGGVRLNLPLIQIAPYKWQRAGYGRPLQTPAPDGALRGRGMWHYTWGLVCGQGYIPMIYSGNDLPSVDALRRCEASQVLLVFNEPEWGTQGDTTPGRGAEALRWIEEHWPGEIWCCGNLISHPGWLNAMLTLYKQEHGGLPRIDGFHVHVYVADGFKVDAPAPDDSAWLERSQAEFARYRSVVVKWGLPQRFVVSECCALHGETMTRVMDNYMTWLRSEPGVETVAWFSARYGGFPDSNLLRSNGALTEAGEAWINWRWR